MSEHIRNFIDAMADDNNIEAKNQFELAMAAKLSDNFNDKRQEIAKSFIRQNSEVENDV